MPLQSRQLRPLCENDTLEIVFDRSPIQQGESWPRTDSINATGFALVCQPQTRFPVSLCGGNGKPGKNHQALTRREIGEGINLLPAPAPENPAAQQKERDV
jgi:hypothetical protein